MTLPSSSTVNLINNVAPENPKSSKDQPLGDKEALVPNPAVDDFFSRMNYDMRRPKPGQEAVSAALQAIQRLGVQTDSEEAAAVQEDFHVPDGMCNACGSQNSTANKFCATCGVPLPQTSLPEPVQTLSNIPKTPSMVPGPHHYHHHYHHHYFASEGLSPVGTQGAGRENIAPARETSRARIPLTGATGATLSRAEAAVRKVIQDWALACNTTHLDDLVELYTADALVLRPNVPAVRGTASIREFLFSVLDAGLGEVELDPLRSEIFGDTAFEAGRCKMLVPTAAGKRREERGKYIVVLVRQSAEWKIVADLWSSDLSMGGDVSPAKSGDQNLKPSAGPPRKGI